MNELNKGKIKIETVEIIEMKNQEPIEHQINRVRCRTCIQGNHSEELLACSVHQICILCVD